MRNMTPEAMISAINGLPKDQVYSYVNPDNHGMIRIVEVRWPAGPIKFKRWDPSKNETEADAKVENISRALMLRLANAFWAEDPINVDRTLGGSYNTRSVFEALLAHTPEFYYCYPGRIEKDGPYESIKTGHKHIVWVPDKPHRNGLMEEYHDVSVISEIPLRQVVYKDLEFEPKHSDYSFDDPTIRRHTQMQIATYYIGLHLNYHTWIAQNDYSICYHGKPLNTYSNVIKSLSQCPIIGSFEDAVNAGRLIDCMWVRKKDLPAVMEVEHSTGVTPGLTRMLNFSKTIPALKSTRYVIIAPDKDRSHVKSECNKEVFRTLDSKFFPYSAVEELYDLCQRRNIRGVNQEFLDCFMEPMVA